MPEILTPSTLLTQKSQSLKATPGNFSQADLYSRQQRQVQYLANGFWARWRKSIYRCFNQAGSGNQATRNLEGDLVLLCRKELPRNSWPLTRITKTYVSDDGKVHKVDLVTAYFEKMKTLVG